ncbi:MAG: PEP-CTERM sorting domain-containing protein [Candidatus Methylacidiphilales bacterium]|nr:PEP-CTERM sorting domain-containing protein [Candidatus Methylacidiphilales bacterium]
MKTAILFSARLVMPCLLLFFAYAMLETVSAQTVTKGNNTTSLNFGASYVGGVAPTASDTIIIDNTLTATSITAGVAADISVLGITMNAAPVSGAARAFNISGGNGVITIGAGGVTKAANTSALTFSNTFALGANQTWTINASSGTGTGNLVLNAPSITDNGFFLNITGAGRLDITRAGTVDLTNNVNLNTAQVVINSATTVVNLGNASQTDNFQIIKGRAIGSSLGNFGDASSFGDGGTNTAITMGGGTVGDNGFFEYSGGNATSNRTFNFDRRTTGSEIRNTNADSTLTLTGNILNNQGTGTADSAYSFGGSGNITLSGNEQLKDNTNAGQRTTLNKNGIGTLIISGSNSNTSDTTGTYGGMTNVNGGTLLVSGTGSINSTSNITVNTSGTFRYDSSTALSRNVTVSGGRFAYNSASNFTGTLTFNSGTVAGSNLAGVALSIGANQSLAPGNSTGNMTTGAVTWANAGTFQFEVNDATGAAGSTTAGWDLLNAASLNITAGTGQFTIEIVSLDALQAAGLAQNFVDTNSYQWLFVDAAADITGFSADKFVFSDSFLNSTTGTFSVTQGGIGNLDKLYINYTAIPEPSTFALLGLGLAGLIALRRKHRS